MIEIRSIFDIKTFKAFQRYSLKKIFVWTYICAIALIGIGIAFIFAHRNYSVYFAAGVILPLCVHLFSKINEISIVNKNVYLKDTTMQIFTFNEEGMEFEQISKINTFKDRYEYKDFFSVIKYKQYYFLYVNRVQAFVMNNEGYVSGSEEELDELLKKTLDKRFIIKSRVKKRVESS